MLLLDVGMGILTLTFDLLILPLVLMTSQHRHTFSLTLPAARFSTKYAKPKGGHVRSWGAFVPACVLVLASILFTAMDSRLSGHLVTRGSLSPSPLISLQVCWDYRCTPLLLALYGS